MKPGPRTRGSCRVLVAPRAGAWIETWEEYERFSHGEVAPRAGAWIETFRYSHASLPILSPPARGRGLKLCNDCNA